MAGSDVCSNRNVDRIFVEKGDPRRKTGVQLPQVRLFLHHGFSFSWHSLGRALGRAYSGVSGLLLRCATRVSEEYVADVRDGGIPIMGEGGGVYEGGHA